MLGCWVKVLIAFATGSLSKSTLQGRSIWRLSTIFSKWSLNTFAKSVSSVVTLSSSTRNIFSFLRALSVKLDLIFFQKFLLPVIFSRLDSYRNLFLSLEKFNAVRTLSYANWFSVQLNFIIDLRSCLFINTAWSHLIYLSFSGAWEFNTFEAINLNLSNSLG